MYCFSLSPSTNRQSLMPFFLPFSQVDHGKTTLVDKLLDACAENIDNDDGGDRAMDSLDLERERGVFFCTDASGTALQLESIKITH
jgi:GTP-binding protein